MKCEKQVILSNSYRIALKLLCTKSGGKLLRD